MFSTHHDVLETPTLGRAILLNVRLATNWRKMEYGNLRTYLSYVKLFSLSIENSRVGRGWSFEDLCSFKVENPYLR